MLPKRLFLSALLLTKLAIITGCSTVCQHEDFYATQYRNAYCECICSGLRRGTYDFNRCLEKRLESAKKELVHEQE